MITFLQQDTYPSEDDPFTSKSQLKGHLTFISNNVENNSYVTAWGIFNSLSNDTIEHRQDVGILTSFRYDYDDKTIEM